MTLNDGQNIINQISKMSDEKLEQVDIEAFLVSKASSTDNLYIAKEEYLDSELAKWIKSNIQKELDALKFEDENKQRKFFIDDYNYELTKKDFIAKLNLESDSDLKDKKDKLIQSLSETSDIEDSEVKFQAIRIKYENQSALLVYYRGIKQPAMHKKNISRMPSIRDREMLVIQKDEVIEFGGKIELIIHDDSFYIISPRTLEYTFDYHDHISTRKDENLKAITNMNFFDEDPQIDVFIEKTNQYMVSRRLAGIKPETLKVLEESFEERCKELKEIKENIPEDPKEKEEYIAKYEVLWPLYDHIDVISKKVKINPEKSIEPLIYFFADKIVESFLTKELRETY